MKILSCEDVVPEDADLQVPGVGDSAGGVDLTNDLLGFIGSVVDLEVGSHLNAIHHVFPVIDVKISNLTIQLP